MDRLKTVEGRVLSVLKDCPRARFDDMILFMHYYDRYADYLCAGKLPLNDLAFNYKAYGLPCFETIRRARQRVQSLFLSIPVVPTMMTISLSLSVFPKLGGK